MLGSKGGRAVALAAVAVVVLIVGPAPAGPRAGRLSAARPLAGASIQEPGLVSFNRRAIRRLAASRASFTIDGVPLDTETTVALEVEPFSITDSDTRFVIGNPGGDDIPYDFDPYLLLGIEPELDCWDGRKALRAIQSAEFVVSMTAYQTDTMKQYADVLLPIALFAETSGTYINVEGQSQSFTGAVPPAGEARPAWKILRVLGNLLNIESFEYNSSQEVRDEVTSAIENVALDSVGDWTAPDTLNNGLSGNGVLQRITETPMYSIDAMSRRAQALQMSECSKGLIHIHPQLADKLNVSAGDIVIAEHEDNSISAPVMIDKGVSVDCVLVQAAQSNHSELGPWHGYVSLRKA